MTKQGQNLVDDYLGSNLWEAQVVVGAVYTNLEGKYFLSWRSPNSHVTQNTRQNEAVFGTLKHKLFKRYENSLARAYIFVKHK